ncbi:MAG: flagellar biosynthetic protein FliR [Syntrophales bacterium]|jgi:flagellar biosynthetic protein FliR|nr:flagellar biosynthetic protein FliR [Syntrophales bacterium]MDY0043116.1 flagellar biosynthetic protein FliR [Syntrophales bacterium]
MNVPFFDLQALATFILVFLRIAGFIFAIPVFGARTVPIRLRASIAAFVTLPVSFFVAKCPLPQGLVQLVISMAGEIFIGLVIGLVVRFIFEGMQLAGQLIGFQMGFAIVNVVDPLSSTQVSIISQFVYLIAAFVFFAVDGHHLFILGAAQSFRIVPLLAFDPSGTLIESILSFSREIFVMAVKIGAPVMALLVLVSISLGMIARTVPQINIFIVGFPLKIGIGLIGIGLTLPFIVKVMGFAFSGFGKTIEALIRLM